MRENCFLSIRGLLPIFVLLYHTAGKCQEITLPLAVCGAGHFAGIGVNRYATGRGENLEGLTVPESEPARSPLGMKEFGKEDLGLAITTNEDRSTLLGDQHQALLLDAFGR